MCQNQSMKLHMSISPVHLRKARIPVLSHTKAPALPDNRTCMLPKLEAEAILNKCSSTAGMGAGALQRTTEISLWNRNLPKATWAKLVIWRKSYQIPEIRLRYYRVMPYFSLLFPLNRTSCSQHHIQSYSAKTAMIISESRGFWGRLGTYNVFQARERKRTETAGSGESLRGFKQPVRLSWPLWLRWQKPWCSTWSVCGISLLLATWKLFFSSLDISILPRSHSHFLFNCVAPKGRTPTIPVEEFLGCISWWSYITAHFTYVRLNIAIKLYDCYLLIHKWIPGLEFLIFLFETIV